MKRTVIVLALVTLLLLGGHALAGISSPDYRLDWLTLAGGGGGPAESSSYAVNLTVGQTVIGTASGTEYQACLGYWCGGWFRYIYLPLVVR